MPTAGELVGGALTVAGALAVAALGLFVWRVNPRAAANRAFAALAVVYGYTRLVPGLGPFLADRPAVVEALLVFGIPPVGLLLGAMVWFASVHPRRRGLAARPWGLSAVLAASYVASLALLPAAAVSSFDGARLTGPVLIVPALSAVFSVAVALVFAADARRSADPSLPLMAVAFSLYPVAIAAGVLVPAAPGAWLALASALDLACAAGVGLVAALLLAGGRDGRIAAAAVALFAAAAVAAVALSSLSPGQSTNSAPIAGVARVGLPLLVAYALVRHRLFDIDLKVKWTIRRGTLAAVFIAVFFVLAQVAQNFFSANFGLVVGGVGAGLLLFAIHPLQRMADRVAEAALPGVRDTAEWRATRKAEVYRQALRLARGDGVVTREEERHLAELAAELGLDPAQAFHLRDEVERDVSVQPS